ncbi:MAG: DinB family protein [Anaerolineae bacterium]|nr:DinB family protein [Anaerolineae bacterium]
MPKLDTATLESLLSSFFRFDLPPSEMGMKMSEGAADYLITDLADALESLRRAQLRLITGLTDAQVNYSPDPSSFSLSEIISHVVLAQNLTHNLLIDSTIIDLPHIDPLPRGAGDGSQRGISASTLISSLQHATESLMSVIKVIAPQPPRLARHPLFGNMTTKGVLIFQIGHDLDHLKQAQLLRRTPGFPTKSMSLDQTTKS